MSKFIKELTPEQEALLPKQVEKWVAIGHATDEMDMEKAKEGIKMVYKEANIDPPKAYFGVGSPVEVALVGGVIRMYGDVWNKYRSALKK